MFYSDFMLAIGRFLLALAIPAVIIWVIIRIARGVQSGEAHLAWENLKRSSVGIAIAILVPLFLHFLISALMPEAEPTNFQFVVGLILGLGAFLLGMLARRVPVVGNGLAAGGFFYMVYLIAVYFPNFDSALRLAISLLVLLLMIWFSYWFHFKDAREGRATPTLSGFKGLGVGLLTFFFANLVIYYTSLVVSELVNPNPALRLRPAVVGYVDPAATYQFAVILIFAILFLLVGILIRAVRPTSGGFLLSGLLSLIAAIFMSFSEVGRLAGALTTGLALAFLIGFGYYKFSQK